MLHVFYHLFSLIWLRLSCLTIESEEEEKLNFFSVLLEMMSAMSGNIVVDNLEHRFLSRTNRKTALCFLGPSSFSGHLLKTLLLGYYKMCFITVITHYFTELVFIMFKYYCALVYVP